MTIFHVHLDNSREITLGVIIPRKVHIGTYLFEADAQKALAANGGHGSITPQDVTIAKD